VAVTSGSGWLLWGRKEDEREDGLSDIRCEKGGSCLQVHRASLLFLPANWPGSWRPSENILRTDLPNSRCPFVCRVWWAAGGSRWCVRAGK
jgi:hypothetical protein